MLEAYCYTGGPVETLSARAARSGGESCLPHRILEGVSKGYSHCRDAPWGVSEAERTILLSTVRPRIIREDTADVAAPETPHGASLQ